MFQVRMTLIVACLALILIVAFQNSQVVDLRFLVWHLSISLVALVFLTAGAGLVAGFLIGKIGGRRSGAGAK